MAIYSVTRDAPDDGSKPRLIEARTAGQAIAHVAKGELTAALVSTKEAMALAAEGVKLETVE